MWPPIHPHDPPTGDVVPYPGSALKLGDGKWLLETGEIETGNLRRGYEVELTDNTLNYWEETALRGQGKRLSELIEYPRIEFD